MAKIPTMFLFKSMLTIIIVLIPIITLRIIAILPSRRPRPPPRKRGTTPTHLLIVLGSGGHTAEMTAMLRNAVKGRPVAKQQAQQAQAQEQEQGRRRGGVGVDYPVKSSKEEEKKPQDDQSGQQESPRLLDWRNYTHRTWIVSSGDEFSAARARELEEEFVAYYADTPTTEEMKQKKKAKKGEEKEKDSSYTVVTVPRARKIHQPLLTAPLSSLQCLWACLVALYSSPYGLPDLVLTNGPATAAITVLATLVLRFADVKGANRTGKCRTVYVESWARVKKLSLSGKLLCYGAERVLVQWEQLEGVGGRGEYLGVLV